MADASLWKRRQMIIFLLFSCHILVIYTISSSFPFSSSSSLSPIPPNSLKSPISHGNTIISSQSHPISSRIHSSSSISSSLFSHTPSSTSYPTIDSSPCYTPSPSSLPGPSAVLSSKLSKRSKFLRNVFPKLKKQNKFLMNPLLIFVNKESGGRQGSLILNSIEKIFPIEQICDLSKQIPSEFLLPYQKFTKRLRILCCGGDGTVNWIIKELGKLNMSNIPIAVVPMGTGNDLVRTLESSYYPNHVHSVNPLDLCRDPKSALSRFHHPKYCEIDLWNATIYPLLSASLDLENKRLTSLTASLQKVMVNYCSIGLDGAVSLAFDRLRKTSPKYFFSSFVNKAWYGLLGTRIFLTEKRQDLSKSQLSITCDGKSIKIPAGTEGIVILSVSSYMGGTKIWPTMSRWWLWSLFNRRNMTKEEKWAPPSANDGILEVVAIGNMVHLGIIKTGLSKGIKLAQGKKIEIMNPHLSPMQIDGEPWLQEPSKLLLEKKGSVNIMIPSS